jgi:hypothetical protein
VQAIETTGGGNEPVEWVSVLTTFDTVQSTIALARLRDEGIPAHWRQEAASRVYPVGIGSLGQIDIMVPEDLAGHASEVLAATLGPDETAPEDEDQ